MPQLSLNPVTPDFDTLQSQLQADLMNRPSWAGVLPIQTGSTLIDWIASIGAFDQVKLLRYYQDHFPETALSDRAIYSIAAMQGVRLTRKESATISVELKAPVPTPIPAFSQFQGAGSYWFTTQAINLDADIPVTVQLQQGYIVDHTINGLGLPYQTYITPESDFMVSDSDVFVFLNGTQLTRITTGNWKLKGVPGFVDWTLPEGRALIQFGNADYGSMPTQTDEVRIVYAVTSGAEANTLSTATKELSLAGFPFVSAKVLTNPSAGSDNLPSLSYKLVSAPNFGSFGSSVTKGQYYSTIMQYPGVIDCLTFAQREVDPGNLEWMNLIHVYLLTTTPWDVPAQEDFRDWLDGRTMYSTRVVLKSPTPVVSPVEVNLYVYNWANPTQCRLDAIAAIEKVFEATAGIIGKDLTLWDIQQAISKSNKGIDYADIVQPTTDLVVSNSPVPAPSTTVIPSGGSLAPGNYSYAIGAVMPDGQIVAKNWATVLVTTANSSISMTWPATAGALSYNVYGRGGSLGNYGLLTNQASTSFTDDGSLPVGVSGPRFSTTPIKYNKLGTLTVTARYTLRTNRLTNLGG